MRRTILPFTIEGLRDELRSMRKEITDLQKVRESPPDYVEPFASGAGPYVLVASAQAHPWTRSAADYVCDGTADDVQIQAAADSLYDATVGGTVLLSEGAFALSAPVTLSNSGTVIRGQGIGATVVTGAATIGSCFSLGNDWCVIESLTVEGADVGIVVATGGDDFKIRDVEFRVCDTAIGLNIDAGNGGTVYDCNFLYAGVRINTGWMLFHDNKVGDGVEFTITATGAPLIQGNFVAGGAAAITNGSTSSQFGKNFSTAGAF